MASKRIKLDKDLAVKVRFDEPESVIKDDCVKKSRRKSGSSNYKGFGNDVKVAKPPDEITAKPKMEVEKSMIEIPKVQDVTKTMAEPNHGILTIKFDNDYKIESLEFETTPEVLRNPEIQEVSETIDESNESLTFQVDDEDFKSTEIQDLTDADDDLEDVINVNISTLEELQEKADAYESVKKENSQIKSALNKVAKENAKLKSQIDNRSTLAFINELSAKIARDYVLEENQSLQKTIHRLSIENQRLTNLLTEKDKEIGDMKFADFNAALVMNNAKIEMEQFKSDLIRSNLERKKLIEILSSNDNVGRAIKQVEKEFQRNANLESLNKKLQLKIHSLQGKFNLISQETKVHMHRTTMNKKNDTEQNTRHFCQYVLDTIAK